MLDRVRENIKRRKDNIKKNKVTKMMYEKIKKKKLRKINAENIQEKKST